MTTLDTTIDQITARFDMDETAAEAAAREYLAQIEALDGEEYDEEALPAAVADFIIESIHQHHLSTPPSLLDDVTATADALTEAHQQRDKVIRTAIAAGLPIKQIAEAAGMSRQSIYNIRDAR